VQRHRSGLVRVSPRRVLRILPLYWAVLLVCAVVAVTSSSGQARILREDLPFAALYLTNWVYPTSLLAFTWSLMRALKRRAVHGLAVALAVAAVLQLTLAIPRGLLPRPRVALPRAQGALRDRAPPDDFAGRRRRADRAPDAPARRVSAFDP